MDKRHVMPDPVKPDTMVLNGKSTRILNLAAVSPLLLLAEDVHKAKVMADKSTPEHGDNETIEPTDDDNSDSDSDSDVSSTNKGLSDFDSDDSNEDAPTTLKHRHKQKKIVESKHAKEYREACTTSNDKKFLQKLIVDIYNHAKEIDPPQHNIIFSSQHPSKLSNRYLAAIII